MEPFDLTKWKNFREEPAIIDQIAIDSRRIDSQNALFVALEGEKIDGHKFVKEALRLGRWALVKKDFSEDLPGLIRVDSPLQALQEIAACYREELNCKVIAITGSKGKTQVKDLLEILLGTTYQVGASPESFNSQIGVPLSLLTLKKGQEIALIEAAFSKPGEAEALAKTIKPDGCITTSLGKTALPSLGSLEKTADELKKLLQFRSCKWTLLPQELQLEGADYWDQNPFAKKTTEGHFQLLLPDGEGFENTTDSRYFLDLLNIATKAAWHFKIPSDKIIKILRNYTPEPMRTEIWRAPTGITLVNDLYCQDPQSVDMALSYFQQAKGKKFFLFGGMRQHEQNSFTNYQRVGQALIHSKVDHLSLVGEHPFEPLKDFVKKHSPSITIESFPRFGLALDAVAKRATHGDMVVVKGTKKQPLDRVTTAFHEAPPTNECLINLTAIAYNIEAMQKRLPQTRIMVMVKALAYGTDDVRVAKFLETCGIDILGVSTVEEGVQLKKAGVKQAIFVINAAKHQVETAVKNGFEVGLSDKGLINALSVEASRQETTLKVHLHIDTGMGRFGCRKEEAFSLARHIQDIPRLQLEGVMTHFACADNPNEDAFTEKQIATFDTLINEIKAAGISIPFVHAANSSGAIRWSLPQYNMVRLGVAVYGLHASKATEKLIHLRPAISLLSRIVGINTCKKGETISYGRTFSVTKEEQKIACLPIGYFDGLHINYSGKGYVWIRGKKAPMVGRICMDFMMVDVTEIPNASIGDQALIFGEDAQGHYLPPEEVASWGGSITHELITCLGPRIQRIFVL